MRVLVVQILNLIVSGGTSCAQDRYVSSVGLSGTLKFLADGTLLSMSFKGEPGGSGPQYPHGCEGGRRLQQNVASLRLDQGPILSRRVWKLGYSGFSTLKEVTHRLLPWKPPLPARLPSSLSTCDGSRFVKPGSS